MHYETRNSGIRNAFWMLFFLSLTAGCQSGGKATVNSAPVAQINKQSPIQIYYEATPVASAPKPKPKSRFKLAAFQAEEQKGPFKKKLSATKRKESESYQVWSHATIHLQYPHPNGKEELVLSTVKVQRETPPRMFDDNRPAPLKTQINKLQRNTNRNESPFQFASSSKLITQPKSQKSEYEIWTLDIPLSDVSHAFQKLMIDSNSIKYSDKGNARLHWQDSQNSRFSMRCDNLPFIEKLIQRTYHEGQLAGFRFE